MGESEIELPLTLEQANQEAERRARSLMDFIYEMNARDRSEDEELTNYKDPDYEHGVALNKEKLLQAWDAAGCIIKNQDDAKPDSITFGM